jgi:hypothetical protein
MSEHRCFDVHKAGGRPRVYKRPLFISSELDNEVLGCYSPHDDSSRSDPSQDTPSRIHIADMSKPSNRRREAELVGNILWDSWRDLEERRCQQ